MSNHCEWYRADHSINYVVKITMKFIIPENIPEEFYETICHRLRTVVQLFVVHDE